jgi:hypothetical protein
MTRVSAAVFVAMLLVGVSVLARNRDQAAPPAPVSACPLTAKGEFPIGTIQEVPDYYYGAPAHYRCTPIFDANLKPIGSAWIKVRADGTIGTQSPQ